MRDYLVIFLKILWRQSISLSLSLSFFWGGATSKAFGSSQARGHIRAIAASLHHSHSHTRSMVHGNAGSLTH